MTAGQKCAKTWVVNLVQSIVASTARSKLRNWLILLALISALLAIGGGVMADTLLGAQPFDQPALLAGNPQGGFVDLQFGGRLIETGVRETTTTRTRRGGSTTRTDYYRMLPIGDKYLIVQSDAAQPGAGAVGEFMTAGSDFDTTRIIPALERAIPAARGRLLAHKLYSTRAPSTGALALGALGILTLLFGWQFWQWLRIKRNPASHPLMAALAKYGEPEAMAESIDREAPPATRKPPVLTANWLVTDHGAVRWHDVVWTYLQNLRNSKTRVNSYVVHAYDRHGNHATVSVGASETHAEQWYRNFLANVPHATAGYTDALAKAWKDDPTQFATQLDARRAAG